MIILTPVITWTSPIHLQPATALNRFLRACSLQHSFQPKLFVLTGITILIGLILSFERSMLIFWIGLIGFLACVLFYTAAPIKYKYKVWGEFFVFLM